MTDLTEYLAGLGTILGPILIAAVIAVFKPSVIEKGLAVFAFRTLRFLSRKTTNDVDDDMVKDMEIAYYGEERYAVRHNRTDGTDSRAGVHDQDPSKPE